MKTKLTALAATAAIALAAGVATPSLAQDGRYERGDRAERSERRAERRAERRGERRAERRSERREDRAERRGERRQEVREERRREHARDARRDRRLDRREERVRERARDVRRAERRVDRREERVDRAARETVRQLRNVRRDHRRDDRRDRYRDRRHRHVYAAPRTSYRHRAYFWGPAFRWDNRYGRYDYGRHYRAGYGWYGPVRSNGWQLLYPWLKDDPATRHWVMWEFDRDRDGRLERREARRANRAFKRLADFNRDGYLSRWEIREAVAELTDEYRWSYRYG